MPNKLILIFLFLIFLSFGCTNEKVKNEENTKIKTVVSLLPMKFIVEEIGKDKVDVSSIIPAGTDPHTFDPSPKTIKLIQDSDIYFLIGKSFQIEKNIADAVMKNQKSKFYDCSKGIALINNDPHFWLGMSEAKIIAYNITSKLIEIDKTNKNFYAENLNTFNSKVDSLQNVIRERLTNLSADFILIYHPAWRYFLTPFGLREESVEKDGKHPKAGDLKKIIQESEYKNIKTIFIEEQFNPEAAKSIAEQLDITVVKINPLTDNLFNEWNRFSVKIKESLN